MACQVSGLSTNRLKWGIDDSSEGHFLLLYRETFSQRWTVYLAWRHVPNAFSSKFIFIYSFVHFDWKLLPRIRTIFIRINARCIIKKKLRRRIFIKSIFIINFTNNKLHDYAYVMKLFVAKIISQIGQMCWGRASVFQDLSALFATCWLWKTRLIRKDRVIAIFPLTDRREHYHGERSIENHAFVQPERESCEWRGQV